MNDQEAIWQISDGEEDEVVFFSRPVDLVPRISLGLCPPSCDHWFDPDCGLYNEDGTPKTFTGLASLDTIPCPPLFSEEDDTLPMTREGLFL